MLARPLALLLRALPAPVPAATWRAADHRGWYPPPVAAAPCFWRASQQLRMLASSSSGPGQQGDGGDSCASIIADAAALAGTDRQSSPPELLHALKVLTARAADLAETRGGYAEPSQLSLRAPAGLVIMPNGDSAAHTSDVKLYLGAAPEEDEEEEDDDEEDEDVPISSLSPRRSPSPDRRWQAP